jgi:hypothetical protein
MKKIAFTFAGRQLVMKNQINFMNQLLKKRAIDEWHIWNFSKKESDDKWLRTTFSSNEVIITRSDSIEYILTSENITNKINFNVEAHNDAHVLLEMNDGNIIEAVFGAYSNTKSLQRIFTDGKYITHSPPVAESSMILNSYGKNEILIELNDGLIKIDFNQSSIFSIKTNASLINKVMVHTGYGSTGKWTRFQEDNGIYLFTTGLKSYEGFRLAYSFYSDSLYFNTCFIKLDDDIIFCDTNSFDLFVNEIEKSDKLKIISANIINNGVCAYYQLKNELLPYSEFNFEYPANGFCGELWGNADLCEKLHNYFVSNIQQILNKATFQPMLTKLPRNDRFSINFIGFKYEVMLMINIMYLATKSLDDEQIISVLIPSFFYFDKYIYNQFLVSHLSFYKQDEILNTEKILKMYEQLA